MPSRFETRFAAAAVPQLQRQFGVTVIFCRGNHVSQPMVVRRLVPRDDRRVDALGLEYNVPVKVTDRIYTLPVATLLIDGCRIEPRTGDRIIEGTEVFELQPPDDTTQVSEMQIGNFEWLVHTKKIE